MELYQTSFCFWSGFYLPSSKSCAVDFMQLNQGISMTGIFFDSKQPGLFLFCGWLGAALFSLVSRIDLTHRPRPAAYS